NGCEGPAVGDAPGAGGGGVVVKHAVPNGQAARAADHGFGEAAAGASGTVVGEGAMDDGDGAGAGVPDAAAEGARPQGLVVTDHRPGCRQSGARNVHRHTAQPDSAAVVDGGIVAEHAAGMDDDRGGACGADGAAGIARRVLLDDAVVDGQCRGGAGGIQ